MMEMQGRRLPRAALTGAAVLGLSAIAGVGSASAAAHPQTEHRAPVSTAALRAVLAKAQAGRIAPAASRVATANVGSLTGPVVKLHKLSLNTAVLPGFWDAVSPNGKTLYISQASLLGSSSNSGVQVVNLSNPLATPKSIMVPGTGGAAATPLADAGALALSPNGKTLYIGMLEGGTDVVDAANVGGGATNDTVVGGVTGTSEFAEATGLAVSPNGKDLYMAGIAGTSGSEPSFALATAKLTSATEGSVVSSVGSSNLGFPLGLALNPNGKVLYASDFVGAATATKVSGTNLGTITSLPEVFDTAGLAASPDGQTLYATTLSLEALEGSSPFGEGQSQLNTYGLGDAGRSASLARSTLLNGSTAVGITLNTAGTTGYTTTEALTSSSTPTEVTGVSSFAIPAAASGVSISGKAKTGATVTAKVKGAAGGSDSYKWFANGKAIKGATKSKLKLGGGESGKKLTVQATANAVGYSMKTVTSKAVTVK
jgi:hypothetical protein